MEISEPEVTRPVQVGAVGGRLIPALDYGCYAEGDDCDFEFLGLLPETIADFRVEGLFFFVGEERDKFPGLGVAEDLAGLEREGLVSVFLRQEVCSGCPIGQGERMAMGMPMLFALCRDADVLG